DEVGDIVAVAVRRPHRELTVARFPDNGIAGRRLYSSDRCPRAPLTRDHVGATILQERPTYAAVGKVVMAVGVLRDTCRACSKHICDWLALHHQHRGWVPGSRRGPRYERG